MHHGSMFSIQRKNSSRPRSGTNFTRPSRAAAIGCLGELLGVGVPLLGQERLDRHAAAIAVGHGVGMRLDLLDEAQLLHVRHDLLARVEAVEPAVFLRRLVVQPRELVEDADGFEIVAAADLEIVEVVRRRDLDRARALLRIGIFVGHDRDAPADQRQDGVLADQVLPLGIVGMHGDRRCRPAWSRAGSSPRRCARRCPRSDSGSTRGCP